MDSDTALVTLGFFLALAGLSACATNRAWRSAPPDKGDAPEASSSWLKGPDGDEVFVVEFDDQGEPWGKTGERELTFRKLREYQRDSRPMTVIVFAHGWHHNAKPGDPNLKSFRNVIAALAKSKDFGDRRFVGIYMGWRGESITLPIIRYTTFWTRRNTAARVGGIGAAHFLADLAGIVQQRKQNMLLVVGHSFGARLIETAVTNALAFSGGKPMLDLVVLLNEASDALRAKGTIAFFREHPPKDDSPVPPQIVSITAEGDIATRRAFPVGQAFNLLNESFRSYRKDGSKVEQDLPTQTTLFLHTAGHTKALWSHTVEAISQGVARQPTPGETTFSVKEISPTAAPDHVLVPLKGGFNSNTPYWIVRVPKDVILDHNDVFNSHVRGMIAAIVTQWFEHPEDVKDLRIKQFMAR